VSGDQLPSLRDPIIGSGTEQIHAAAIKRNWTVIDMAADWSAIHPK
jgi:hypothetical protein